MIKIALAVLFFLLGSAFAFRVGYWYGFGAKFLDHIVKAGRKR